jgi:hypothetical protein
LEQRKLSWNGELDFPHRIGPIREEGRWTKTELLAEREQLWRLLNTVLVDETERLLVAAGRGFLQQRLQEIDDALFLLTLEATIREQRKQAE